MSVQQPSLTKTIIDRAQPTGKQYTIWDGSLPGFGIRIGTSGVKSYVVRYRIDGGGRNAPQRFVVVGRHGRLTLDQARKQAVLILSKVTVGEDPASEKKNKRNEMRLIDLIDHYEKEGCFVQRGKRQGEPMKPLTKKYTLSRLRNHVVPLLGTKKISEIGAGDIERFVREVGSGNTASDAKTGHRKRVIVRGGEGAARKAVRDLSAVFSFAIRRELVERNPVARAAVRKTDNQRDRYLTVEELKRLGTAFKEALDEGVNPKAIAIARLWALTGCRRDEIASLEWSEVDLDAGLLILSKTKTGRSVRPLSAPARAIIASIKREGENPYVFPAMTGDSFFQGTKKAWDIIREKAKLPDVTPHTLRHTLGSTAVSTGEALALTGALLGHANLRSTAIYAHIQMLPMIGAAERVGAEIASALGIAIPKEVQEPSEQSPDEAT
jgi:integrase